MIDELLKEFVRLVGEVTTRPVRERHAVVAHGEAGFVPVVVLLGGAMFVCLFVDFGIRE